MLTGLVTAIGGCVAVVVSALSQNLVNVSVSIASGRRVNAFEPKLLMLAGVGMVISGTWLIATRGRPGERSAALAVLLSSTAVVAAALFIAALVYRGVPGAETRDFTLVMLFGIAGTLGGMKRFRAQDF